MPILTVLFLISLSTTVSLEGDVEALLGFLPEDFLTGRVSLQSRIHADDQDLAQRLFDSSTPSDSFPIRLRQANGQIRIVRLSYTWQETEAEKERISILVQDVRDLFKRYENAPISLNLKAMMDNSDDFIFFKNANHVFTVASQALARVSHPPLPHWTDIVGLTDYEIFPEECADAFHALEKPIYAGAPIANQIQEYTAEDGTQGWVDNRKFPIHDEQGAIVGLFGIARDVTDRVRLEKELKHQVQTDFLTGLSSRAHFMEVAQWELNRSAREGTPPSILMMDIDFFKYINDTYGHQAGDVVLVKLADICRQSFRTTDCVGRLGGEEFAILLPSTPPDQALLVAQRLRETIASTEVWVEGISTPIRFTVSIGLSALSPQSNSVDKLLNLADEALYEAKHTGRNRVCLYSQNFSIETETDTNP